MAATCSRSPNELPLLLVDSEGPVAESSGVWHHLKAQDGWDCPAGANDEQIFLMVQAMEAWLISDREALAGFFGSGFNAASIPKWQGIETIPKQMLLDALAAASANAVGVAIRIARGHQS